MYCRGRHLVHGDVRDAIQAAIGSAPRVRRTALALIRARFALGATLLALAGAGVGFATAYLVHEPDPRPDADAISAAPAPPVTERRPDFQFVDLDGVHRRMAHWDGRVVVVNFWATWCSPCLTEIPEFIALQSRYRNRGVRFVGIALDEQETVRAYAKDVSLNYPTAVGDAPLFDLMRSFGNPNQVLPFTALVSPGGQVVERYAGLVARDALEARLEELLAEKAQSPAPAS